MPAIVKGINSGVICHNKHFVSLALKIRNINDKENLFLFSLPQLQDLLHALESRIESFSQPQDSSQPEMLRHAPALNEQELQAAGDTAHVAQISAAMKISGIELEIVSRSAEKTIFLINDNQVETFIRAIISAIKNAGFQDILLTVSSMLDFIPLYDIDLLNDGKMEYDSYNPQPWKLSLFSRYLLVVYKYQQDTGHNAYCGVVMKTNALSGSQEAEGVAQRAMKFSRRLRKIVERPCQIFCTEITPSGSELTKQQCLDSLHRLCIAALRAPAKN